MEDVHLDVPLPLAPAAAAAASLSAASSRSSETYLARGEGFKWGQLRGKIVAIQWPCGGKATAR